jgi:hypothetical protein
MGLDDGKLPLVLRTDAPCLVCRLESLSFGGYWIVSTWWLYLDGLVERVFRLVDRSVYSYT